MEDDIPIAPSLYSLSNKMDNSLLAVRDINHKYIVVVREIIQTVGCHTPTVCLSALSLTASGIEPEELLAELKTCGLNIASGEDVELYKDNDFTDGLMIEHLRKLLQLGKLSNQQLDILRNLSLLPVAGVLKNSFKNWMKLDKAECFLLKKQLWKCS